MALAVRLLLPISIKTRLRLLTTTIRPSISLPPSTSFLGASTGKQSLDFWLKVMQIEYFLYAIALRWLVIELKHLQSVRDAVSKLFARNSHTNWFFTEWIHCPFCNGCWMGAIVYLIFVMQWSAIGFVEGFLFAISVGLLSFLLHLVQEVLVNVIARHLND